MIYEPMGEGGQLSGLDRQILEMASKRMSADQMWVELGRPTTLTPARLLQRLKEILASQDVLTQQEQMALVLLDVIKLRELLWERLEDGKEAKITKHGEVVATGLGSSFYNTMARTLREMRVTIESMSKAVDGGGVTIRQAHADIMMAAISVMFDRFVARIEDHVRLYDAMPEAGQLRTMFEEVMPLGFTSMEGKIAA